MFTIRHNLFPGLLLGIAVLTFGIAPASADGDGLIVKQSDFGVTKTLDRLGNRAGTQGHQGLRPYRPCGRVRKAWVWI